jgi:hypothetical protein
MTYLPNRLNEYETYTYNLKLYMVHPSLLMHLEDAIDNGDARLIADNSTMSTFNISSVEQIYTIGHNIVREAFANRFSMVIDEPNGVTLLSKISLLAEELGINTHIHAGYILVINFHGRDHNGRARKFNQTFLYPLVIQNIQFKVTEGGTIYNIELIENGTAGYQYSANSVRGQITIVAQTVGGFLEEFEKKYNQSIFNAWVVSQTAGRTSDKYIFEFDESTEAWSRWRFQVLDEPIHESGIDFIGREDASIQIIISNGSNITTIIGQVLQLTKEYKNIIVAQKDISLANNIRNETFRVEPGEGVNKTLDSFPTFFKVITNVEYGEYDPFAGQFNKTIIYKLKSYVVTDEILDSVSYLRGITDVNVQRRRVENLILNKFLRKKYEYYYTGGNTEVLEFDLALDYAYFSIIPFGRGMTGDPNVIHPNQPRWDDEVIERLEEVTAARVLLATTHKSLNQATAIAEADQTVGGSEISKWEDVTRLTKEAERSLSGYNVIYDNNLLFLREEIGLASATINYQLRFMHDNINDQDLNTSENDKEGGALIMGAVKANLENSADFLQIELGIRGDPYWFGLPNSLYNQQRDVDELVDYEAGAPSFFLQVNLPVSDEDLHGRRKPRPDYQLSGVYTVRNVINRFQGGQFTQYLSAIRDLATNVSTVWDLLSEQDAIRVVSYWSKRGREAAIRDDEQRKAARLRRSGGGTGPV